MYKCFSKNLTFFQFLGNNINNRMSRLDVSSSEGDLASSQVQIYHRYLTDSGGSTSNKNDLVDHIISSLVGTVFAQVHAESGKEINKEKCSKDNENPDVPVHSCNVLMDNIII